MSYHSDRARRRPAPAAAQLGDPDHCARPGDVGDRRLDRQCRAADHRRALHASPAFSIWIVNGYQLAITISLLPLASLGEIIGYRRVYLAGLVLFTLASVFCALSHTLLLLTVARIMQGFGAAGILSVNAALVRYTYPRAQLGRGIGVNALVVATSAAVGPTVAADDSGGRNLALSVRHQRPDRHRDAGAGLAHLAAHRTRRSQL